jgi:spermidine/putrescine transport system substrate-binding protein
MRAFGHGARSAPGGKAGRPGVDGVCPVEEVAVPHSPDDPSDRHPESVGSDGEPARRRPVPIDRRGFMRRAALGAIAGPALLDFLAACNSNNVAGPSGGSTPAGFKIASPDHPVTWPIYKDNKPIKSGLKPQAGSTLRLYNYDDYIGPKVVKEFEKKYDVKVTVSTFNDTDEALTKIRSGKVPYDIYFPSYDQIAKMVTAKLIRPLNHSYIPHQANLWAEFSDPWYDGGWHYTVPYTVYTTGIGWRSDKISDDIGGMANPYDALWDPTHKGRVAVIDDWHTAMAMVALRAGITDINTQKAKDLAVIKNQMLDLNAKTNPKVTITMYNDLPAGQLWLAQMWSGDIVNAQYYLPKGTKPDVLAYWFPEDGKGEVDNDLMVILSGGQNPVAAHYFLNHMLDTKNALDNFGYIGYQPPQNALDPAKVVSDGYVPKNLESAVVRREWFTAGYRLLELPPAADAAWHAIWQQFKAGG